MKHEGVIPVGKTRLQNGLTMANHSINGLISLTSQWYFAPYLELIPHVQASPLFSILGGSRIENAVALRGWMHSDGPNIAIYLNKINVFKVVCHHCNYCSFSPTVNFCLFLLPNVRKVKCIMDSNMYFDRFQRFTMLIAKINLKYNYI